MNGDIQLTGAQELLELFEQMPEKAIEKVLRGALYAGAAVVRNEARALVPILDLEAGNGPHEPGNLLRNIRITTGRRGDEIRSKCGITPDAYYGHFIEYGTRHAPAYPFMRPAADHASGAAAQSVVDYATERAERELSTRGE
ncbi:MAG TPA: HK97-gp10 family putative phage morphogenesis protein [Candidatus Cybelea sp.]|nr:HK97-gp10 family putative phage morphogenesis protein [Candidatus Cybelea sp.]